MRYFFILGNNPELSGAEIQAVLPSAKIITTAREYLVLDAPQLDIARLLQRLGGTIKIGTVLAREPSAGPVLGLAATQTSQGKFKFGLSYYRQKPSNLGMRIKGLLKEQGAVSRLVTSREAALSSVIISKEKCFDFVVTPDFFGLTGAVQDFEAYGQRDYGRPRSDSRSGMLPPKLAQMMINLSGLEAEKNPQDLLLDPFCGSGTVLSEAAALGFQNLAGCDVSDKAVKDTRENLEWLMDNDQITKNNNQTNFKVDIFQCDVKNLAQKVKINSVDAIVTEPYLGPPLRGRESEAEISRVAGELGQLYLVAFGEFKKALKNRGRVVMIFPEWHLGGGVKRLDIFGVLARSGWQRLDDGNLIYKRENQKVWRQVTIWEKK